MPERKLKADDARLVEHAEGLKGLLMSEMGRDGKVVEESQQEFRDIFVTDSIALIGYIYDYAKLRNISANEFEKIIMRSYKKTMQAKDEAMPKNLETLIKQNFKKIPNNDLDLSLKIRK